MIKAWEGWGEIKEAGKQSAHLEKHLKGSSLAQDVTCCESLRGKCIRRDSDRSLSSVGSFSGQRVPFEAKPLEKTRSVPKVRPWGGAAVDVHVWEMLCQLAWACPGPVMLWGQHTRRNMTAASCWRWGLLFFSFFFSSAPPLKYLSPQPIAPPINYTPATDSQLIIYVSQLSIQAIDFCHSFKMHILGGGLSPVCL